MDAFLVACERFKKLGASRADDAAAMAAFCANDLQRLVGAVSPRLVWEGAQKSNMATRELVALCKNPMKVQALMWI